MLAPPLKEYFTESYKLSRFLFLSSIITDPTTPVATARSVVAASCLALLNLYLNLILKFYL